MIGKALEQVRETAPLVQCITNFVTVNDCANIILAAGGSPTMAEHPGEVEEAVAGIQALVCNMGAIDKAESMILAGKRANELGIPVILDPVAAGGTTLRRGIAQKLLEEVYFSVIRGNASEIRYLAGQQVTGSGVDAGAGDAIGKADIPLVAELARKTGSVIAVSGREDVITDGTRTVILRNGCAVMARITGSGCMLTALIGAFCGANEDYFSAAVAAMAVMGISGELADERRLQNGTGNATFRNDLIDGVFNMTRDRLMKGIRYEIYER